MGIIYFLCFTTLLFPFSNSDSLEASLRDFALKTIVKNRSHTGILYNASLSGVEVSALKIRSSGLWKRGAKLGRLSITPRTTSLPYARRLALVFYGDSSNLSSQYYTVQGYDLVARVVGFAAFDAESLTSVALSTAAGDPISIRFPDLNLAESLRSAARCVAFAANGTSYLSEMGSPGFCHWREEGRFSVAVKRKKKMKQRLLWSWWLSGIVLVFGGLVLLGFAGLVFAGLLKRNKIQIMERQAGDDLVLSSRWVGPSKMPSASGTRTLPSLENGCFV